MALFHPKLVLRSSCSVFPSATNHKTGIGLAHYLLLLISYNENHTTKKDKTSLGILTQETLATIPPQDLSEKLVLGDLQMVLPRDHHHRGR